MGHFSRDEIGARLDEERREGRAIYERPVRKRDNGEVRRPGRADQLTTFNLADYRMQEGGRPTEAGPGWAPRRG